MIEVQALLREVSASSPTGENLEYDPAFAELERAAVGKAEQQIGDTVIPAEEPDWAAVERGASALLERTKDLRVAALLTKACLYRDGWSGLGAGLEVIRALLEQFWEKVHPQLDPDDGNDPVPRINSLAGLCEPALLNAVRAAPLLRSRSFGPIGLREVVAATSKGEDEAQKPAIDGAMIHGAFQEAAPEQVEAIRAAVGRVRDQLSGIERAFSDKTGGQGPDLSRLVQLALQASRTLDEHRPPAAVKAEVAVETPPSPAPAPRAAGNIGDLASRQDVARALDALCAYFARVEPASPIPLLLQRCKRLLNKDFLQIVRDMAPDALSQVELIAGKPEE